jgi:hypothetical protein
LLIKISNKLQPDDWDFIIESLLLESTKDDLILALILDAPIEARLSRFAKFLKLDQIKNIVSKTIDDAKGILSDDLVNRIFWEKIDFDSPNHWLLDIAPANYKRKYFSKYYKSLLSNLRSASLVPAAIIRHWDAHEVYANLDIQDHELAKIWTDNTYGYSYNQRLACMLSARAAEKCIAKLYSDLGYKVIDISIKQLDEGQRDWMTHDLNINKHGLIDVKNARTPVNNNKFYVEHFVKRFK